MDAIEKIFVEPQTCKGGFPSRKTRLDIPADVTKPAAWEISPDPIRLEHYEDKVFWNLTNLIAVYPKGTVFEIEFISGPIPLHSKLGPFKSLDLSLTGDELIGDRPIGKQGCYTYNLWVTQPYKNREKLPIDPLIDHVAPPPPEMLYGPDPKNGSPGAGR
jgi:hypothetical protein